MSVKSSQLIRACLVLLLDAEGNLLQHAATLPPLRRPSNAEAVALDEFDQILAELLYHSFRDAAPPKAAQPTVS